MRWMSCACVLVLVSLSASAADENPWIELIGEKAGNVWRSKTQGWFHTDSVTLDEKNPKRLAAKSGGKTIFVNGKNGREPDLVTKQTFRDIELEMEFLIAKRSNSGVKFHAVYEIQINDSHGKKDSQLTGDDCGGIYPRAQLVPYKHLDKGIAPKKNACKAPGEWQKLTAIFLSPRFDKDGKKIANAKLIKVTLNGEVIHENLELKTPTGHNHTKKETAMGPLLFQGDHGPVAFRNVRVRAYKPQKKN